MGVVDNMLHTESSRMVSLSSSSNSEERMGTFRTENGHCAPHVAQPKYKRRRVSAVRDFPVGCGRLAPQITQKAREESICVGPVENSVGGDKSGDVLGVESAGPSGSGIGFEPLRVLQSSVPSEMLKQTNYLASKAEEQLVSSDQVDRNEQMNAKPAQIPLPDIGVDSAGPSGSGVGFEPFRVSQSSVPSEMLKQTNYLDSKAEEQLVSSDQVDRNEAMNAKPAQIPLPDIGVDSAGPSGSGVGFEPFRVSQSSVPSEMLKQTNYLDFKAEEQLVSSDQVDRSEPMNAKPAKIPLPDIELVKALERGAFDVSKDLGQVDVAAPKEGIPSSGLKSWSPFSWPMAVPSGSGMEKARNYPPRRTVSAVRDFPPFCGRNAPRLSEEECVKVLAPVKNNSLGQEESGIELKSLEETVKTDVKPMGDDVLNGDVHKSIVALNVSRITGDKLQAESEGHSLQKMRKQDEFVMTSVSGMRVAQEDTREKSIDASKRDVRGLEENLRKDGVGHPEGKSLDRKLLDISGCENKLQEEGFEGLELGPDRVIVQGLRARTEKKREEDEFVMSSVSVMRVAQEDTREKSIDASKRDAKGLEENLRRNGVSHPEGKSLERKLLDISGCEIQLQEEGFEGLELGPDRVIVQGLMAAPNCPWSQQKVVSKPNLAGSKSESKGKKHDFILRERPKSAVKKKNNFIERHKFAVKTKKDEAENSGGTCIKKIPSLTGKASEGMGQLVIWDKEDSLEECKKFYVGQRSHSLDVSLPPSRPVSSSVEGDDNDAGVTRNKVRETLRLFQAVCRKLLQEEEAKSVNTRKRVDLQASRILKEKKKYVNTGKQIIGSVPGVEVGDEFQYRVELNIIGLHRQIQGGIDYVRQGANVIATSIVASGGYDDDLDNSDVLTYTGQGGNVIKGDKDPEDQKLERGNLALVNSKDTKNPVRVIRGETKTSDSADARARTYIYDGLYLVDKYWQDVGQHGKLVFKFRLVRIPGQPELAWKVVNKSKKCKLREGLCMDDISQGKESVPICAVNTIDNEKPPVFEYTAGLIYPDWCRPIPPKGCDCTNKCSEYGNCSCVKKNGGEIPYNQNGAIVEAKPLVFECGPSCKCPPSCYNRVSQHGIRFQLEIFKTKLRGWGVRSLNSIPSGSFICEYAGELLEDKEAERRTGNDEYLFDIGNNYNDGYFRNELSTLMPDAQSTSREVVEDGGFTIDAAQFGNVGRFINHSCSPNLYAQNVLYDHEDKRIPHIMFFAAENIPPLQELTYHYNYMIDQVRDSNGNIKKKSCYCGSSECNGRMY